MSKQDDNYFLVSCARLLSRIINIMIIINYLYSKKDTWKKESPDYNFRCFSKNWAIPGLFFVDFRRFNTDIIIIQLIVDS